MINKLLYRKRRIVEQEIKNREAGQCQKRIVQLRIFRLKEDGKEKYFVLVRSNIRGNKLSPKK